MKPRYFDVSGVFFVNIFDTRKHYNKFYNWRIRSIFAASNVEAVIFQINHQLIVTGYWLLVAGK